MPEQISRRSIFPPELDDYEDKNEKLGEGGFAEVHLAVHKKTGLRVAVKVMNKEALEKMGDLHRAYREIETMKRLGCHPHICHLYQVAETEEDIYLVMEYISGGELFDYIVAREKLTEKQAQNFFRQILSAIAYMHNKDLAHRDLKPENMLLDSNNSIKIIDFGLASDPHQSLVQPLATCCGSPAYAAPELISGKSYYGTKADIWSLGVVLYGLLNGFLPFDVEEDESTYALYEKIKSGVFEIPEWLSSGSILILSKLLDIDASKRISTEELLIHPWVNEGHGAAITWNREQSLEELDPRIIEEMADYHDVTPDSKMAEMVKEFKYDSLTAHYLLLSQLRLKTPRPKVSFKTPVREQPSKCRSGLRTPGRDFYSVSVDDTDITPSRKDRSKSCADGDKEDIPWVDPMEKEFISPLFDKREKAASQVDNLGKMLSLTPAPRKPLHQITPEANANVVINPAKTGGTRLGTMTPKFAKTLRKRVINLMTPKPLKEEPRTIKGVYKVNTTSTKSAKAVRQEIESALSKLRNSEKIYSYESSRYMFKCRSRDDKGNKVIFQLEICIVPGLESLVGIRHSRLKGSSWSYKKICDTVLGMVNL